MVLVVIVVVKNVQENTTMPKYYIKSNTLELIYSTDKNALDAACAALWELNDFDVLDEHFYIDERGFKDYSTALPDTKVFTTEKVMKKAGWTMEK